MALGTIVSGVLLYLSTIAATNGAVVGFNCAATAVINFMFAIQVCKRSLAFFRKFSVPDKYLLFQYAYTPESFPSPVRATVNGLCSMIGYVCGMAAPIISSQAGVNTNVPVYTSGALFLVTGVVMFGLPFETNPGAQKFKETILPSWESSSQIEASGFRFSISDAQKGVLFSGNRKHISKTCDPLSVAILHNQTAVLYQTCL